MNLDRDANRAVRQALALTQDLSTPTQVHDLVVAFYREIVFDELLEPIFGDVAEVDWAERIPKLIDYWCRILFDTSSPAGSLIPAHRHLHDLEPITAEHCDRWYSLWVRCVDERWSGPYAEQAKGHAAALMAGMAKHVFGVTWSAAPAAAPAPAATAAPEPLGAVRG